LTRDHLLITPITFQALEQIHSTFTIFLGTEALTLSLNVSR
jgi:hypothetical protein